MKILVYHYALDYIFRFGDRKGIGGGEVLANYLLNQMVSDGHEVVLLTHRYDRSLFPLPNVSVKVIPMPATSAPLRSLSYTLASRAIMRLGSYDACLVLQPIVPFALALALEFPTVWYYIEPVAQVRERPLKLEPTFLNDRTHVSFPLNKYLGQLSGVALAHLVRDVLTLSTYMSRLVDAQYVGVRSKPVYAGIPVSRFASAEVQDNKTLTFIGRISEQKNPFRMLRAFKLCTGSIPEARLNVIARGASAVEEKFAREIKALGLDDMVLWNREATVSSDSHNYYHDAQVVLYPSLHEAFGLVVLEAMASGRPVITSNFGGPAEIISNNEGLLVNPYNEADMADAMVKLLSDVSLCREMGRRARARFEEKFTIERVGPSIESYLKACVSG